MTVRKEEIELQKAAMVKMIRAAVRTKHAIAADRELNDVLPQAEKLFDDSQQRGRLLSPAEIIGELGIGA